MDVYIFTPKCFARFKDSIEVVRGSVKDTLNMKVEGANDGDGWHSETFKLGISKEIMWQTHLQKLLDIKRTARVVHPPDQTNRVALGSGLRVVRNGEKTKLFIGGFRIDDAPKTHISVQSPLGKVLLGAKIGEERTLKMPNNYISIKILDIIPYSETDIFLQEAI